MSTNTPYIEAPRTINSLADALEAVRTKRILSPGDGLRAQAYIRQLRDTAHQLLLACKSASNAIDAICTVHKDGEKEWHFIRDALREAIANATKTITQP